MSVLSRRSLRSTVLLAVGWLLVTGALVAAPAPDVVASSDVGPPPLTVERPAAGAPGTYTVTLPTGDRVRVEYAAEPVAGSLDPAVEVTPAPGRADVDFAVEREGREVSVIPSDLAEPLERGRLDPRLLDVTGLVRRGLDDASTDRLPLLLEQPGADGVIRLLGAATSGMPGVLNGLVGGQELSGADWAAVAPEKRSVGGLWPMLAGLTGLTGPGEMGSTGLPDLSRAGARTSRLWLDAPVALPPFTASPAQPTTPADPVESGAASRPTADPTGAGVRVAVLDTGIDRTHPDLRDVVAAERDFAEPGGTATDAFGHGTHVAGVIAGSGRASGGRYRGVAPEADLLIGKVLDDAGTGRESMVLAGIDWAVAAGADVVNLSLGGESSSDGDDPVSRAIDRYSSDVLFVAAVGNSGPRYGTVGTPGAAARALTVAAHDSTGRIAGFSSRGPRRGDYAAKPDIAAPGVDVVAARAKGADPGPRVGQAYVRMSGTSMAVPHVAGAAALLGQVRPRWEPGQIKAVLMGTADPDGPDRTSGDVLAQGAGRLDMARALGGRVFADQPSVSVVLNPGTRSAAVAGAVVYRNRGRADRTFELDLSGGQGVVSLPRTTVTVPAGGTARVPVRFHPTAGEPGKMHQARLIAVRPGGGELQIPITAYIEPR